MKYLQIFLILFLFRYRKEKKYNLLSENREYEWNKKNLN